MTRLVGADGTHEFPLALVTLGAGAPAIEPGGEAAAGAIDARDRSSSRSSRWPSTPATATCSASRGRPRRRSRRRSRPRRGDPAPRLDADHGSGRDDRRARVHRVALDRRRCAAPDVPTSSPSTASRTWSPGLYRWPDLDTPLRAGPLRDELLQGLHGAGARPRRRVRRDGRDRPRRGSTTAATARPSSTPGSSRAACTSPPTRSASARPG